MNERIQSVIDRIKQPDEKAMATARERQDTLTKPAGSLGRLEELSIQLAGITGEAQPKIDDKVIVVMAGDHGVVAEGVSTFPAEVTPQMVANMVYGGAAINVLSEQAGVRIALVDIGVAAEMIDHPKLINKKVAKGTMNMTQGPAMTEEQTLAAMTAGIEVVEAEIEKGLDILATGEMGIGNTTPSAAIAAVLTGQPVDVIVGRGTGVDDMGLERKQAAVQKAIDVNNPTAEDGFDVLMKVGGFEIAGLTGAILAAVAHKKPIVIDGFISTAAAMIAVQLEPKVGNYIIAGHQSQELGHELMVKWLGLEALLDLNMRLGEGSGAVLALHLVEAACRILSDMATFEEAGVAGKEEPLLAA
ncbi:MAG: nicotinate-nucleotide--dimethylbenzimidazole phosphoribosyltransferase [Chloroflexi bacterium]|nr:MAG: nicotinate-nucleotide--dimethylbenzimidazole phosphoribosyltransferase [Chloroflexota bacterium]MBL1194865.1 nicotinate-nucleotide--dimethylbenzimidazole phosphoribosyltransferase [Chloroflexota bacterium]NOH12156.1 nicotinate-nucleotide--dimethylbenzimidazole phosphoribosyltransferase [Chloroflexota bacterium]